MSIVSTQTPLIRDVAWADTPMRRLARDFARSKIALGALVVLFAIVVVAVLAPIISPQNPYDLGGLELSERRKPPMTMTKSGFLLLLGSDDQGRDMVSAIFYGLRTSIFVALSSALIAISIGLAAGLSAGYFGGRLDAAIMRLVDMQLSFPAIFVAFVLLAFFGQGLGKIVIALVAVQWAYYTRTIRAVALVESRKEYVEAARSFALTDRRIMFRHLLPNCVPPLLVIASVQIANAISLEATLSFLGIGLPITEPSLGLLIANGYEYLLSGRYWISFFPGIALLVLIVSINLVGDRVRDVLNPRLRR